MARTKSVTYARTYVRTYVTDTPQTHSGLSLKPVKALQKLFALVTLSFLYTDEALKMGEIIWDGCIAFWEPNFEILYLTLKRR